MKSKLEVRFLSDKWNFNLLILDRWKKVLFSFQWGRGGFIFHVIRVCFHSINLSLQLKSKDWYDLLYSVFCLDSRQSCVQLNAYFPTFGTIMQHPQNTGQIPKVQLWSTRAKYISNWGTGKEIINYFYIIIWL